MKETKAQRVEREAREAVERRAKADKERLERLLSDPYGEILETLRFEVEYETGRVARLFERLSKEALSSDGTIGMLGTLQTSAEAEQARTVLREKKEHLRVLEHAQRRREEAQKALPDDVKRLLEGRWL